jgi:hypothetical protein
MGGWRIRAHDVAHPTDPFKRVPVSMAPSALHGDVGDRTYGFGSVTFACGAMTAASLGVWLLTNCEVITVLPLLRCHRDLPVPA